MEKIEIPHHLQGKQGQLIRGELYWIDVKLNNGRVFRGLASRGRFISGIFDAANGAKDQELPFKREDIKKVRPHSIFRFWW
jgi:ribosomal protein L15E